MESWIVKKSEGSVADRHLTLPSFDARQIFIHEIDKPTMVFGTAQRNNYLDVEIKCDYVYRKSGGGAVFLEPGQVLWVDFVIPREDPLWCNDIRYSSLWLGEAWVIAMKEIGFEHLSVMKEFENSFHNYDEAVRLPKPDKYTQARKQYDTIQKHQSQANR